jgi:hypothetical protein
MKSLPSWILVLAATWGACQSPLPEDQEDVTDVSGDLKAGTALFVVGDATVLAAGDLALKARLEGLALQVTVKAAKQVVTGDATGKRLVVISATVGSGDVNTKFTNVAVPVVTAESAILDDLKMTKATAGTDFGVAKTQTKLGILVSSTDAMAAGLTGTQTVTSATADFSWGKPATAAIKVAKLTSDATKIVLFRYEKGAQMVGITAPERRVALFLTDATAGILTSAGKALTDAALRWAGRLPTKKGLGIDCAAGSECGSGVCAFGVCCNSACSGSCNSCNQAGSEGTCKPLPSGTACGGAASCSGNTLVKAATCNGAGTCATGASVACNPYLCQTDHCTTSCATDGDCNTNAYCAAAQCRTKQIDGGVCSRAGECASGSCGGRCCPAGTSCQCSQPNRTNMLSAAAFDTGLPGWTWEVGTEASVSWTNVDSESCPYSGTMRFILDVSDAAASQCMHVTDHFVNWGGRVMASLPAVDWTGRCTLTSYTSSDCTGTPLSQQPYTLDPILKTANVWVSFERGFDGASGSNSLSLTCDAVDDSGVGLTIWFDNMFVSQVPNLF